MDNCLTFLREIDRLKSISRQTLLCDGSREETDAEHSWHMAMYAMTLAPHAAFPVDADRAIRMALVHDLVEIDAGDTFAYDTAGYADKDDREQQAAERIFGLLPPAQAAEFHGLWLEFEAGSTPEALFAAAVDRLQPLVNNLATNGHTWVKHGVARAAVERRMIPVQKVFPTLWPSFVAALDEAVANGWLKA